MPDVGDYKRAEGTSSRLLKLVQVGHEVKNYANRRYRNKSCVQAVRFKLFYETDSLTNFSKVKGVFSTWNVSLIESP